MTLSLHSLLHPIPLYDPGVLNGLNRRKVPLRNNLDDGFVFCHAVRKGDAVHLVHELKLSSSSVSLRISD